MVVQARSLLPDVLRQAPVAGAQPVKLVEQLYGILHRARAGVGAEIPGFVLLHFPCKQNPRICLPHRDLDVGIRFVVLQKGIIFRKMFLDQIIFQNQRFQFRVRDNVLETRN